MEQMHGQDVEAHPSSLDKSATPTFGVQFSEAAALLTIWSLLVINEGAIRFNLLTPYEGFSEGADPVNGIPLGVAFFASLFEVIFGLMGLFIGVAALIFRFHNTSLTKAAMVCQALMGWYVFIVYVFAVPAKRASGVIGGDFGGAIGIGTTRFLITLGLFTAFHFCLALQGGQFVFFARLVSAATGEDFLKQNSGYKMRAAFWNGNLALAGLWTFIIGCIVNANVGSGKLETPYVYPPNVGRLPGLTIFTGLLMLLWGACGVVIGLGIMGAGSWYYLTSGLVYLFAYLNFVPVQFGHLSVPKPAGTGMHTGLIFMLTFLGPYFVYRLEKRQESGEMIA